MRVKFEIAADDTPTVVNSDFDAETIEVERDGDKLTVYVVVDFVEEDHYGNLHRVVKAATLVPLQRGAAPVHRLTVTSLL